MMVDDERKMMKMTPQRMAIMKYLEGNTAHPSANDIYDGLHEQFPTMSLATVYNTMETLKQQGAVIEITIDKGKKRFDPNPQPHHHAICIKCNTIKDIFVDFPLQLSDKDTEGFEITGNRIDFFGICRACSGASRETIKTK